MDDPPAMECLLSPQNTTAGQAPMRATLIICTYSRAESLRDTLRAVAQQEVPEGWGWEVVVVDNNSRDHTKAVVQEFMSRMPNLHYAFEPAQGLSHARNHGIRVAKGSILLFTDDDVLPEVDWLQRVVNGLDMYGADACGGYIAPIWQTPPPSWLTERFYGFLAVRTERTDDYLLDRNGPMPFGANMAIRREVFDKVGLFDTSRGRKGKVLASGEDGEMFERILDAGFKVVFLGGARVHHKVESFRLTRRYLYKWRWHTSRNLAISRGVPGERRLFNIPLYLFPQFVRACGRAIFGWFTQAADEAMNRQLVVCHFLGTMQGLLWVRRESKKSSAVQ